MTKFYILAPEIFLFLGICFSLLLGVFIKNSYNLILRISLLLLIITAILIFMRQRLQQIVRIIE